MHFQKKHANDWTVDLIKVLSIQNVQETAANCKRKASNLMVRNTPWITNVVVVQTGVFVK